jgi:hypothetical protein
VIHAQRFRDRAASMLHDANLSPDFELVSRSGEDFLYRVLPSR